MLLVKRSNLLNDTLYLLDNEYREIDEHEKKKNRDIGPPDIKLISIVNYRNWLIETLTLAWANFIPVNVFIVGFRQRRIELQSKRVIEDEQEIAMYENKYLVLYLIII